MNIVITVYARTNEVPAIIHFRKAARISAFGNYLSKYTTELPSSRKKS